MIVYDILSGRRAPPIFDYGVMVNGPILRAMYDQTGVLSYFQARLAPDGAHLYSFVKPGFSIEATPSVTLHHVDHLTERAVEYAALIGTKKFIIEATPRPPRYMIDRLPTWTHIGLVRENAYRMEYALP